MGIMDSRGEGRPKQMAQLGDRARDTVSGWEGVVTGDYRFLNGCRRLEVSGADKDGKPDAYVFDEQQVEVIKAAEAQEPPTDFSASVGGPRDNRPVER